MQEATDYESALVQELRRNVEDLCVSKQFLETKYLLRFLRARNHSLPRAENMFRDHIQWRKEYDIENILEWKFPQKFKYFWPVYVTGFHNTGGPLVVLPLGIWDPSKVDYDYDTFVKYTHNQIEHVWRLIQVRSQGESTMKQFVIIVDLQHFGLRSITTINAFGGVLAALRAFEASYPETLRSGILVNAPYVFEMAWRVIKPILSDETQAKIKILGSDVDAVKEELLQYAEVDQFPRKYGGKFPNDCGMNLQKGFVNGRFFRSKLL